MRVRIALVLFVIFVVNLPGVHAEDWPGFLGPRRDGTSKETGLLATWPTAGPPILWQRDIGEGFAGTVSAGNRLIVFHRVEVQDTVECLAADTGKADWKFSYPTQFEDNFGKGNGPRSTPQIFENRVVTLGADGQLHALDLETGKKLWARNLVADYRVPASYFGIGSSPLVDEGRILVNVGGKGAGIVAFELETGKELWKATSQGASYSSPVLATFGTQKIAVFFTREGPVLLEPKTGNVLHQQRWRARYDASVNAATPLRIGDELFFSTSYETGALALKWTGTKAEETWQAEDVMTNHYNTCVVHEGTLYGFDGRQEAGPSFRCVDWKTKKIGWDRKRFGCGSMILAEGRIIVLTEQGELILVEANPREYRELARARVFQGTPCRAQIALSNGILYARDSQKLIAFDLRARKK